MQAASICFLRLVMLTRQSLLNPPPATTAGHPAVIIIHYASPGEITATLTTNTR